jgi:phosphatidylinositol alpha-1,6-mannosyltransferase
VKLLLVSSEFPPGPGGIGNHAFHIASELNLLGWAVRVHTSQDYADPEAVREFNARAPFEIVELPKRSPSVFEGIARVRSVLAGVRSWDPDVIVASGSRSVWLTAIVAKVTSRSWVAVGHGTEFGASGPAGFLTRWAFGRASTVVSVSRFTEAKMRAAGARPRESVVIPNGADARVFTRLDESQLRDFRESVGLTGKKVLLTVGNVTERKGQDIVVRALSSVVDSVPDAHYVVAGLPTRGEQLASLADDLGVSENLHLLGAVDNDTLLRAYNACDIFVMTSRHTRDGDFEGYGIAAVEAALVGKPAVVAGGSGLEEAVQDGVTGLVVRPEDPEATSVAIRRLLADDQLRRRLGEQAYEAAHDEMTWERRAGDYDRLLRSLIDASVTAGA